MPDHAAIQPPFGLTVCGLEELEGHCETRASHVLSILDPDHPVPEAFGTYGEHAKLELRFHDDVIPLPGRIPPNAGHVEAVLRFGRTLAGEADARLLVHCHVGISRSTACMALILAQAMPEVGADDIIGLVHGIREKTWPNLLLMELGDAALGRGGSLVAATHRMHRLQLEKRPNLVALMSGLGREREIEAANAA